MSCSQSPPGRLAFRAPNSVRQGLQFEHSGRFANLLPYRERPLAMPAGPEREAASHPGRRSQLHIRIERRWQQIVGAKSESGQFSLNLSELALEYVVETVRGARRSQEKSSL